MSPDAEVRLAKILADPEEESPGPVYDEMAREIASLRARLAVLNPAAPTLPIEIQGGMCSGDGHYNDQPCKHCGPIEAIDATRTQPGASPSASAPTGDET
jgi:hypothetical protein